MGVFFLNFVYWLNSKKNRPNLKFPFWFFQYIIINDEIKSMETELKKINYRIKRDAQITYALEIFIKKHIPQQILLNLSGGLVSIKLNEILYCEVYGHKTYVHLISGETKELRFSLQKLEDQLPASVFARSHQSYLVNMEHINRISRYKLTLSNGQTIPISQAKYLNLQNKFIAYSSQQKIRM